VTTLLVALLGPLSDAVAAVRLDELPPYRDEVPVVDRAVVGLGGTVNGAGRPGTELAEELVPLRLVVMP
jgi:hypothetical protein